MRKIISAWLLWVAAVAPVAFSQPAAQMTLSELVSAAENEVQQGSFQTAIPFLEEIVKRAGSFNDKTSLESVQKVRVQLARAYAQMQQWAPAQKYAREYLSQEPCPDRAGGLVVMCQIAFVRQDWLTLKKYAQELYDLPRKKEAEVEQADLFLAQAHYNLEEYDAALQFLPRILQRGGEPDTVAAFKLMLVRCRFETGQVDSILADLQELSKGDAQYDIQLNLSLIRMSDGLFDSGSFRAALALYRMVIPRPELISWQEKKMARLKEKLAGLKEKADDKDDTISGEIEGLERELQVFRAIPEYDLHVASCIAQIYAEQGRPWEAIVMYGQIYQRSPETPQGGAACLEMVRLLTGLGQEKEANDLARSYLDTYRAGLYPRLMTAYLMRRKYDRADFAGVIDLFGYTGKWADPENDDVRTQETQLRYMVCFGWLEQQDYERAAAAFEDVIRFNSASPTAEDSQYWIAMCFLMRQKYQDAHDRFVRFRSEHPDSPFAPEALFRAAVCNFGLENYEKARDLFSQFIESYPDHSLLPEALSMRGDLLGGEGRLDEALADYRRAIDLAGENYAQQPGSSALDQIIRPATYAVSQAAATLELDAAACRDAGEQEIAAEKYRKIIAEAEHYEALFGENADLAQMVYLKSKAQFQLGETDLAVKACLDAINRYGADPFQKGVDSILDKLGSIIKIQLSQEQQNQARDLLLQAREDARSPTLQMRLDVLLADLDGTQDTLGNRLLAGEASLDPVPPPALSLMCSSLLKQNDFSRAQELFDYFAENYEDSPFRAASYQLRGLDLYAQKKLDEAYGLATDALGAYGATEETGWAQLMKGKIELERGEYKQAAETFNAIFSVREWRGAVSAEAMFRMAEAWEAQGDYEKAFAFFQRTYLLYKAYDNGRWAAEGYLRSAQCLFKLKRPSAARNTYRAMLLDEYVRDLPQAEEAKKVLGPAETAELLAGGTNAMEIVELEVGK